MPTRPPPAPTTMRLPFSPASVSVARQRLRGWLVDHDVSEEHIEDARVVLSELVANSVRHATPLPDGSILVTWTLAEEGVRISVTDGGGVSRPRALRASASAVSGRGMAIVDVLTARWWSEQTGPRTTVHALLPS
ncbi:MAG: ATP-binding protein [Nocardioidaceae bacterium]